MSIDQTPWAALSGHYQLRPGAQRSIVGQRPLLDAGRLGRLLRGQRGAQVGRTLGSLFALCSHAHRRTADLALAAAQAGSPGIAPAEPPVQLWVETARDHLRSIALDWPQRLPEPPDSALNTDWLRDCPLPLATAQPCTDVASTWQALAQLRAWLESCILGQPVARWLAAHRDPDALAVWCAAQADRLPPARCLAAWHPLAQALTPETRLLDLLDADPAPQTAQLRPLVQALADGVEFVQQPTWLGACAETGPWARLRHRQAPAPARHNAWTRISARWVELVEIAAATPQTPPQGHAPLLSCGALRLSDGAALAWCEMARGLLLHRVQLDAGGGVEDYQVLAPTEWNFHPEGALACAVAALSPEDTAAARTLAAAFDPCVACSVQLPAAEERRLA